MPPRRRRGDDSSRSSASSTSSSTDTSMSIGPYIDTHIDTYIGMHIGMHIGTYEDTHVGSDTRIKTDIDIGINNKGDNDNMRRAIATVLLPFLRAKAGKRWHLKRASMLGKWPSPAKLPETRALKVSALDLGSLS